MRKGRTESRIIPELLATRPDVVISVSRTHDEYFTWDGDGPDPEHDGFLPYDVSVTASTIRNGVLLFGESHLGGSYFLDDEPLADVHGYFDQMLAEALEELDAELEKVHATSKV